MKKAVIFAAVILVFAAAVFTFLPRLPKTAVSEETHGGTHIYVGYPLEKNNFPTVQKAVDLAKEIDPSSESERVYIHIAPGTYREQIKVGTSFVSFINDRPEKEVLITWYYGIGYKYYSIGEDGYFSEEAKTEKGEKREANRWGCTVRITGDHFRAENITFENSFNRYVTLKEIFDGVEPSGSEAISFERKLFSDVMSKDSTERAAALAVEGERCEFFSCKILSGQDTLFTRGTGYYKNCLIEGNTDYIFGQGVNVFEDCELRFKGFSKESKGGVITAAKSEGKYLFYNCDITASDELNVMAGRFGRPWGASADVAFVNTKLQYEDLIIPEGWGSMSSNLPENANFKEFNTTSNGNPVDTFSRVKGTLLHSEIGLTPDDYLGDWSPLYR